MTAPVTLAVADTSVLLAAFNRRDDRHRDGIEAFGMARILVLSPLVLAELDYLLHQQASEKEAVANWPPAPAVSPPPTPVRPAAARPCECWPAC
ncbi:PIN domain-containing protein [Streptomyces fulvoviolaceus]|uniref:PIN domain-containing protein n=1 Tax=Streptomyces fulvoviolaceus TaxID=285535 RepID=UPI0021BEDBB0|nr:PIN domain-containing protein [Streptomyces fulvoviolaceus]MCT9081141.1 hypothetical protein [Streptomyces fulvoviolaceus]